MRIPPVTVLTAVLLACESSPHRTGDGAASGGAPGSGGTAGSTEKGGGTGSCDSSTIAYHCTYDCTVAR